MGLCLGSLGGEGGSNEDLDWLSFAAKEVRIQQGHAVPRGTKLALYLKKGGLLIYTETTEQVNEIRAINCQL